MLPLVYILFKLSLEQLLFDEDKYFALSSSLYFNFLKNSRFNRIYIIFIQFIFIIIYYIYYTVSSGYK